MHVAIKKKKINSELINKDRKRSCGEVPLVSKTSILHLQVQLEILRPCSCFYFPQQIITESKPISCIASAFISHSIKFFFGIVIVNIIQSSATTITIPTFTLPLQHRKALSLSLIGMDCKGTRRRVARHRGNRVWS